MAAEVVALAERLGLKTWGNTPEHDRLKMKVMRMDGVSVADIAQQYQLPEQHVRSGTFGFAPPKQALKPASAAWGQQILTQEPELRIMAKALARLPDRVDDLVQGTIERALSRETSFQPGTNLIGWLYVMMRNLHLSQYRKWREVPDSDDVYVAKLCVLPEQGHAFDLQRLIEAINRLPVIQAQVVRLVCIQGMAYDEAAEALDTNTGTIKSRLHRARAALAEALGIDGSDFFTDGVLAASVPESS